MFLKLFRSPLAARLLAALLLLPLLPSLPRFATWLSLGAFHRPAGAVRGHAAAGVPPGLGIGSNVVIDPNGGGGCTSGCSGSPPPPPPPGVH
jgi:hypothetical protein